jgi:metacaspase-1
MPKGVSLHLGLDYVDRLHYENVSRLYSCEKDAHAMERLARRAGFQTQILVNNEATSCDLIYFLCKAAARLEAGDICLLTFSGHGSQKQDINGDEPLQNDGRRGNDSTWLLHDRMVIDDELSMLWPRFKPGVRILVVSDSCHAGTVIKDGDGLGSPSLSKPGENGDAGSKTYFKNKDLYDSILKPIAPVDSNSVRAGVLLLASCNDAQKSIASYKDSGYSLFTYYLLQVWQEGRFSGGYDNFIGAIAHRVAQTGNNQNPGRFTVGRVTADFLCQKPFTI